MTKLIMQEQLYRRSETYTFPLKDVVVCVFPCILSVPHWSHVLEDCLVTLDEGHGPV